MGSHELPGWSIGSPRALQGHPSPARSQGDQS